MLFSDDSAKFPSRQEFKFLQSTFYALHNDTSVSGFPNAADNVKKSQQLYILKKIYGAINNLDFFHFEAMQTLILLHFIGAFYLFLKIIFIKAEIILLI